MKTSKGRAKAKEKREKGKRDMRFVQKLLQNTFIEILKKLSQKK